MNTNRAIRLRRMVTALLGVSVLAIVPAAAQSQIWVDAGNCPGPGTGSQGDPYCTIQDAICAHRDDAGGAVVHVLPGTYNEAVRMFPGVDLISTDGPAVTTIDATGKACWTSSCTVSSVNPCSTVYLPTGASGTVDGFRIVGGKGIHTTCDGTCDGQIGGGITILASSPMITRNEIIGNVVTPSTAGTKYFYGGGIYIQGIGATAGSPTITKNLIDGNVVNPPSGTTSSPSRGYGGGIYAGFQTSPTIRENTITSNIAGDGSAKQIGAGGGIAVYSGWNNTFATVERNYIRSNLAADIGGAILLGESNPDSQTDPAIDASRGLVESNVVTENEGFDGGGFYLATTSATIRNNTIADNLAFAAGGNGGHGGGVYANPPGSGATEQATLANNIVAFNTSEAGTGGGNSGGLYVATGATPTIRYTDLNGNVPTNVGGSKTDADYIGSNGNVSLVPSFTSRTPGAYDYHLLPSSPLIDIGDNANAAPADFEGVPIPQDGNYDGTARVDMGAYEFPRDLDSDGTPDWLDPDDDNDGVLDVDDCSPERRGVSYPPGKVGNTIRFEKQGGGRWKWDRSSQGHTFNVYRGTIQRPWTYNEVCLTNETPNSQLDDATTPAPGQVFYYLISAKNSCGESAEGTNGAGGDLMPPISCAAANRNSDGDSYLDLADNCPLVTNANQADADGDFVGDVCDNCPTTSNADQGDPDADTLGSACDNCPFVANLSQTDGDTDGVGDLCDNCAALANPGQEDNDLDALGDACDPDDDNDAVLDGSDNCPLVVNPGQEDLDLDNIGDACDPDMDGDGVANLVDNCVRVVNAAQNDADLDGLGDLCDNCVGTANPGQNDVDLDTVGDACDNCPSLANLDQANFDGDALGDVCDPDDDNDGVADVSDCAPFDPNVFGPPPEVTGVVVDASSGTTVAWSGLPSASAYDVIGSDLAALRADGSVTAATCLGNDVAGSSWNDPRPDPSAGSGFYYLVRGENACGLGGYGSSTDGTPRTPAAACP